MNHKLAKYTTLELLSELQTRQGVIVRKTTRDMTVDVPKGKSFTVYVVDDDAVMKY
jgi:hypothetical protein